MFALTSFTSAQNQSLVTGVPWYIPFGTFVVGTLIGTAITTYKTWRELANQSKSFIEGQNAKEREEIRRKLNQFFGPIKALRTESAFLYSVFAVDEKSGEKDKGQYFRTLRYLANGYQFKSPDKALLDEILNLSEKQLDLIEKEGWVVSNKALTEILGQLGAHIRILLLASSSKLVGMADKVEMLVFPLEIDGAIESETRKLTDRYQDLLGFSKKTKNKRELSNSLEQSVKYYELNAHQYFKETAYINLKDIYKEFRDVITNGSTILDAGCGVGRDTRYFIKHGYKVVSFDASEEMVNLCLQYPFAYCLNKTFEEIYYIEEFDAVWACASLVHLSPSELETALLRLSNSLKPGGVIYFSIKENSLLTSYEFGKTFYYYNEDHITDLAITKLLFEKIKIWSNESKKGDRDYIWKNYLLKKPNLL